MIRSEILNLLLCFCVFVKLLKPKIVSFFYYFLLALYIVVGDWMEKERFVRSGDQVIVLFFLLL